MLSPGSVVQQVLASRRSDDDAMMLAIAVGALIAGVACIVLAVRLFRRKQVALGVLVVMVAALALLSCVGISGLLFVAQFAWH